MADSQPLIIPTPAQVCSADGMTPIELWRQAPTPSPAKPYQPSMVTWVRGMGEEEAKGVISTSEAIRTFDPDFYDGRSDASLAVIRAYQVLHKEEEIPADLLGNFGGQAPELKGVHYYSLMQIVRSGPDATRLAEAMEAATGTPYVAQVGASFTVRFKANNKAYVPTREAIEAVNNPKFVSLGAATVAGQAKAPPGATDAAAAGVADAGTLTPPRKRANTGQGVTTNAVSPTDVGKAKVTDAAAKAVEQYITACTASGGPVNGAVVTALLTIGE